MTATNTPLAPETQAAAHAARQTQLRKRSSGRMMIFGFLSPTLAILIFMVAYPIFSLIYYSFFDTVVNRYLIDNKALDFRDGNVIGLVVETSCNYFKPVAYPDQITAALAVEHLGNSSVRYRLAVFRNDDDDAAAQGHFVHVYVDRATNKPVPLPDALRRVLERIAK